MGNNNSHKGTIHLMYVEKEDAQNFLNEFNAEKYNKFSPGKLPYVKIVQSLYDSVTFSFTDSSFKLFSCKLQSRDDFLKIQLITFQFHPTKVLTNGLLFGRVLGVAGEISAEVVYDGYWFKEYFPCNMHMFH